MDARHFDTITRSLSSDAPRRAVMKAVGAAAIGGVLSQLGYREGRGAGPCDPGEKLCKGAYPTECYNPSFEQCCHCGGEVVINDAETCCSR